MEPSELIHLYTEDGVVRTLAGKIMPSHPQKFRIKGPVGSFDAVLAAAVSRLGNLPHLFVLHDKEEAAYFADDLRSLLPGEEVYVFPSSYKKPYEFEETENANILLRAEVLGKVQEVKRGSIFIATYPEAIAEKVVNHRSLAESIFTIGKGEKVNLHFLIEVLQEYGFERTDFVFEAGQYAVRGGIVDIFSFSDELPYRLELFGDEAESIRTFDPATQLSVAERERLSILPNVQTRFMHEQRESFLSFLPAETLLWLKDTESTATVLGKILEKATGYFKKLLKQSNDTQVVCDPDVLFLSPEEFREEVSEHTCIEFGKRFTFTDAEEFVFDVAPQPSFRKDFKKLAEELHENAVGGWKSIIAFDTVAQAGRLQTIFDEIDSEARFESIQSSLREGFKDRTLKIACYTDHQLFERFHRHKAQERFTKSKAITLRELRTLQPGDYVTHIDYGIARFGGLDKAEVNGKNQETLRLIFRDNDLLYLSIHALHKISKYSSRDAEPPKISKLGSPEWENKKKTVKKKVKDIAKALIALYAKRRVAQGYAYGPDTFMQAELETSFMYEDTPDQAKATEDVKQDMQQPHPMDRLICGDVGFGKTEVAIRAAFKAVSESKQVAVLVPTTILALQHYKTFHSRLENLPCTVDYLSRFRSDADIKRILRETQDGKIDILIGTHKLVGKDVKFKDLGLLVIDEEQKFGVGIKEKLKELRLNVDTLTLTATPIPRTLHFSLMGARDLSVIATPPPNRQPVTTELHTFNELLIRDAIARELKRGGQVFVVHNRVADIESVANTVLKLVPDARVGIAHGQMSGEKLEKVMVKFIEGEYDVLVSTNIIESGLDIPNANTIIIQNAHMFGLSDLHQMRGRVGRSNQKAYCYLLTPPASVLPVDARKRLYVLEEFSDLGDGFKVAMRDLDIRGAGNLLGAEQSGFINDLGFEAYHKILDEAVQELKENEFADLFKDELQVKLPVPDCVIETDLEIIIPETYVSNISERLSLYTQIDNIKDEAELSAFSAQLTDKFGRLPDSVEALFETVRLRWKAEVLGFEKLTLKGGLMRGYFLPPEREDFYKSETFGQILSAVKVPSFRGRLREVKGRLMMEFDDVNSIREAMEALSLPQLHLASS